MVDIANIARPYAKGIFELAVERDEIKQWKKILATLSAIANDKNTQRLINNPLISKKEIIELFKSVVGKDLNEEAERLLMLLVSRKRIALLPAIDRLYHQFMIEHEKIVEVKVISAFKLSQHQVEKLKHALTRRLKCDVTINAVVDKTILGGAIIHAKDLVIDGSLRRKINRLSEYMSS